MSAKTAPCTKATRAGRFDKAEQFLKVAGDALHLADEHHDVGDAYVTLCVNAGTCAEDYRRPQAQTSPSMSTGSARPHRLVGGSV